MKTKKVKKEKVAGITLIALVITIVVLLILAGISISMLAGNNGILPRTEEAKEDTVIGKEKEQIELAYISAAVIKLGDSVSKTYLQDELDRVIPEQTEVTDDDDVLNIIFKDTQHNFKVQNGNVTYLGIIPEAPEDAVARVGINYYTTLQDAINLVPMDNTQTTVDLLKDISENLTIAENQNIILKLNNHTIKQKNDTPIITLSGTLTIKNGTIIGTYTSKVATIYINTNSTLNISNAIIDRNSSISYKWETIQLYGNLNIDSGKINSSTSNAICTYAGYDTNILISGGIISRSTTWDGVCIVNYGNMKMTGGYITSLSSSAIKNCGILEISGDAYITSENLASGGGPLCVYNSSTVTLNGGKIENTANGYAIYKSTGTIINNGCEIVGYTNI